MSENTDRWISESRKHPFYGEDIGKERYLDVWEKAADRYEDAGVGSLKERIIEHLIKDKIVTKKSDILDVGCGPGTYGLRFAEFCKHVSCLDSSQRMLQHVRDKDVCNVDCILADWDSFHTEHKYDVVFSSLCPSLNYPDSLIKMESFSKGYCAYISSMNDDHGSIRRKIWKALGKDYTMNGYNTTFPYNFLIEKGRKAELQIFESIEPYDEDVETTIGKETDYFSFYFGNSDVVCFTIREIVEGHSTNGRIHCDGIKRLGLLTWKVPQDQDLRPI